MGCENQEMIELFKDKTIAVVGNAQSLMKKDYASLIDSHEIVCRMNTGFRNAIDKESNKHFGKKTDIVFVNSMRHRKDDFVGNKNWIIIQTSGSATCPYTKNLIDHFLTDKEVLRFADKKSAMSTGLRVLNFLKMRCEPKEVSVFGFDWKKTPSLFAGKGLFWGKERYGHDFAYEKEYCKKFIFNADNWKLYQ